MVVISHSLTGLYELFLLIVSIEEVAHCIYMKQFVIIFPLNLTTLDVVKTRGGEIRYENYVKQTWNGKLGIKCA